MSEDKLDERVESDLQFLNEISAEMNSASMELKISKIKFNNLVSAASLSLSKTLRKYQSHGSKTHSYLKLLAKMRRAYDSLYEDEICIESLKLAIDQNENVILKLQEEGYAYAEVSNWEKIKELKAFYNIIEGNNIKNRFKLVNHKKERDSHHAILMLCYKKLLKICKHLQETTYKIGIFYFKKKLFHLQNIQYISDYVVEIDKLFTNLQTIYNEQMDALEDLSRNVEDKSMAEKDNARLSLVTKGMEKLNDWKKCWTLNKNDKIDSFFLKDQHRSFKRYATDDNRERNESLIFDLTRYENNCDIDTKIDMKNLNLKPSFTTVFEVKNGQKIRCLHKPSYLRTASAINFLESEESCDPYDKLIMEYTFDDQELIETNFCYERLTKLRAFPEISLEHLHIAVSISRLEQYSHIPQLDKFVINK